MQYRVYIKEEADAPAHFTSELSWVFQDSPVKSIRAKALIKFGGFNQLVILFNHS